VVGYVGPRISNDLARQVLEQTILSAFMVRTGELWSDTRGSSHAAVARQVAMYLAHVAWGLSFTEVGHVFARDRTTVAHACGQVEDRRDDVDFDRSLDLLEGVLRALLLASLRPPARWRADF
jgi:chromosomal replication initiation ATPase DnaA